MTLERAQIVQMRVPRRAPPERRRRDGVTVGVEELVYKLPSRVVGAALITASSPASPGARRVAHACAPGRRSLPGWGQVGLH